MPAPPRYEGTRHASVRAALAAGPMYFEELMAAAGSEDGRDIVLELEALRAEGALAREADTGRYQLNAGKVG